MKIIGIDPQIPGQHYLSDFHIQRLGLLLLLSSLRDRGHQVKIYVDEVRPVKLTNIEEADLYCISTLTASVHRAYQVAQFLKEKFKRPVVMGGPHVTFLPEEALDYCDFVIRYEGEETLIQLVEALEGKEDFKNIASISYKTGGRKIHNPFVSRLFNLNQSPFIDFSLISGWKKNYVTSLETSRGCPYRCIFCSVHKIFPQVRFKEPERVIEEIKRLEPRHIFFVDDNFAIDKERTKELLSLMLRKLDKLPLFSCQTRIDVSRDPELLRLLKRANCWRLYIGLESINPETQKEYNKRQTVEEIETGLTKLRKHQIDVHGMFVVGSDADNLETIKATTNFALRHRLPSMQISILTPLPGTDLFDRLEGEKRILDKNWVNYDGIHCVFQPTNGIDRLKLQKCVISEMERFCSKKERYLALMRGLVNATKEWFLSIKPIFLRNLTNTGIKFYFNRTLKRGKKWILSKKRS